MLVDDDLVVRWATTAAQRLFSGARGPLPEPVEPGCATTVASFLDRVASAGGQTVRVSCSVPVAGSSSRAVELVGSDLRSTLVVGGLLVVAHDVTGWAARELGYRDRMATDPLTGLGNRVSLLTRLEQAVLSAPALGQRAAVVSADLDNFKAINDRCGHAVGDQVLQATASRVSAAIEGGGSACRMGGDGLVVLLDRVDEAQAAELAGSVLAAVREPVDVLGAGALQVSVPIGIAMTGEERRAHSFISNADMAMYHAKGNGQDRIEFYRPELRDWALSRKKAVEALAVQV
jgi:diguanylate cyclase (GGDEF)-like protein